MDQKVRGQDRWARWTGQTVPVKSEKGLRTGKGKKKGRKKGAIFKSAYQGQGCCQATDTHGPVWDRPEKESAEESQGKPGPPGVKKVRTKPKGKKSQKGRGQSTTTAKRFPE